MASSQLKSILKIVILIGVLLLLVYLIRDNYYEIKQYDFNFHIFYLAASFVMLLIVIVIQPVIWYIITRNLDCNLGFSESVRLRLISEIGKYIPGRVFGYGYLLLRYKEAGKPQIKLLNSSFYELFLSSFSALCFFTITFLFTYYEVFNTYRIGFIAVCFLGVISLHPYFFKKMSDVFCKIFKKEKLIYKFSYLKILSLLVLYLAYWIIFSLAFFLFVRAFTDIGFVSMPYISGAFAISSFAGFMAFFLPAGLVAREGLLIFLLGALTGNVTAIIISIGSRIWLIIADIVLFVAALVSQFFVQKKAISRK